MVQGSGRWQNAISLGVFKTREAAQNYLNYMHAKGVHTAKVGERASKLKATIFILDRARCRDSREIDRVAEGFSRQRIE